MLREMREILFRAKRESDGKWIYGAYADETVHGADFPCIMPLAKNEDDGDWAVLPETVGQYTSIDDKNGKKIFEGDICKDGLGWVFEVIWDGDNGRFLGQHLKSRGDTYVCYVGRVPAVEVIGNIHDGCKGGECGA